MRAANHLLTIAIVFSGGLISCAKKENNENQLSGVTTPVATASALPACSPETLAQVYWVEEQEKLVVCNGSTFVEITGAKGEQGDKGEQGNTGPAGSPANSGVWVFDKNSKPVGVLMDARLGLILFTNGAFARINLQTGEYALPAILDSGTINAAASFVCRFTETSCTGTCYIEDVIPKGSIIRTSTSTFVVANGDEQIVNGLTAKRFGSVDGSTCTDLGDVPMNAYPITKPYSFPDGISIPLQTPLSFGFKTEE